MKLRKMIMVLVMISVVLSACNSSGDSTRLGQEQMILQSIEDDTFEESKKIAELYRDLYEHGIQNGTLTLDTVKQIVQFLGENGYVVVDNENQINMENLEDVKNFVRKVENEKEAQLTIICVMYNGGFIRYDFETEMGNVQVIKSSLNWNGSNPEVKYKEEYSAYTWIYSEEGYLFFEQYYMPGYDGPSGHTAIRVQPLDETCRELNRKYLMSIGYDLNNLFTSDWNENDYQALNFYDLYEPLYRKKNNQFVSGRFLDEGVIYEIPKSEFEEVFETYFQIDSQALQQRTRYCETTETYEYRTRGMYDCASTANTPYPEVIAYEENKDGTIKLTVNAVWPEENLGKAFSHEVVVRPLKEGGFQYVSNHVIPSVENVEEIWYVERLTDDKWLEYYRGMHEPSTVAYTEETETKEEVIENTTEIPAWETPEPKNILTEVEVQNLQAETMLAVEQCAELYKDTKIVDEQRNNSYTGEFTDEKRKEVVERLGDQGVVSVSEGVNMENYHNMEEFYSSYASGNDAMVTVFQVCQDGDIIAFTFTYRNGKIQSYYIAFKWLEGDIPEIEESGVKELKDIKLTEKGYFIYTNAITVAHGNHREYYRVKPLENKCRELTEKYISGLSFVNYNMLVTKWDSVNVEEILMPCMFEDIYQIYTGENLKIENGQIPAEIYERVMTTCFPVSVKQLRTFCGYDANRNGYEYEMILPRQFPPFGEVVDYTQNDNGTITLFVDVIWPDYNSDCAFTNCIVVQPFEDGTFRYLSNSIEEREMDISIVQN